MKVALVDLFLKGNNIALTVARKNLTAGSFYLGVTKITFLKEDLTMQIVNCQVIIIGNADLTNTSKSKQQ